MNAREATKFVESHGVVSQSARGPVPNLADAIAGTAIKGSWWGHAKGRQIFRAAKAICENPDVLVCKLIEGKITYVHRRLWPALVKLAPRFPTERLAKVWNEHTRTGAHQSKQRRFPSWVPPEVQKQAKALTVADAEKLLSKCLPFSAAPEKRSTRNRLTNAGADAANLGLARYYVGADPFRFIDGGTDYWLHVSASELGPQLYKTARQLCQ